MTRTPLTDQRFAEIRQGQPTEWLPKPWKIHQIEGNSETPGCWQVLHDGTVIATLPDWAGNLALWMANAPDDIRDLLYVITAQRELAESLQQQLGAQVRQIKEQAEEIVRLRAEVNKLNRAEPCGQGGI